MKDDLTKFIGIPYVDRGRGFEGGDCWNVCWLFYRHVLGIDIPSYVDEYEGSTIKTSVVDTIKNNICNWKTVESEPEYGDIFIFNVLGLPIHTAVHIGDRNFLHGFKGTASCIERLDGVTWNRRLRQTIRWAN